MQATMPTAVHEHTTRHGSAFRADIEQSVIPEVDSLAELLTQDSLYTAEALQRLEQADSLFTLGEISQRAGAMTETLDEAAANSGVDEGRRKVIDAAFTDSGVDFEALKQAGINADYTVGMTRLLAAMLQGRPPIDIETVGPYAFKRRTADGTLQVNESNIPVDERVGIELLVVLRKLADVSGSLVRPVSLLDDFKHLDATPEERAEFVVATAEYYRQKEIIRDGDEMGGQVLLLRESEQVAKLTKLTEALNASGKGHVVKEEGEDGREIITFLPDADFVDSLNLRSKNRRQEFKRKGIVLQNGDEPMCQALDASAFLGEENRHIIHLVMLDHDMIPQQDKVFAILRALDIVQPNTYHNIFTDSKNVTPEAAVYAVSKLLSTELKGLQKTIASHGQ